MTQISVKIGRFICDSAIVDDKHRLLQQSGSRRGHKVTRIVHHDDDVIPGMTSSSTGDLQGLNMTSRNLSLPDFHCWDFGDRRGGGGLGEDGLEMERSAEEEMESSSFGGKKDWMDEYYNRTILAHDNDLHVSHLFRAFYLGEGRRDESICNEEDEDEEEEERKEAAAAAAAAALPWRSTEQMDAVEDTSKYLLRDNDVDVDPLATPRVENVEMSDDRRGPRLDPPHLHNQHHQSPSQSSSSSFRNAALSCGRDGGGSSTRPELSNCQSLASLSHWLSEAESRHSEPFCPQHHHVLDATAASSSSMAAAAADPSSIRSSIDRSRFVGRQVATAAAAAAAGGGDCCNVAADALMQTNDHQSSSSSDGATSAEGVWPVVIATTDDDDDWTMSRHEQVMLWLMSNDLTEKGMEEEEEEKKDEEVVERRQGPSPSTSSAASIDHLPRHQLIISCTH